MKTLSMVSALSVAGVVLCASAVAQTRFCMGGDLEHLSQAQKTACAAKLHAVRNIVSSLHAPSDWHFVVVCGEDGWKQYTAYAMREDVSLLTAAVDTNMQQHETFLHESRLGLSGMAELQNTLASEVSGILSHRTQEAEVAAPTTVAGS